MSKSDDLKVLVPEAISQTKEFNEIYNTQGTELDNIYSGITDVVNQCFVNTAAWGLKLWERNLNIPIDETKEVAFRKNVILSKIIGFGTVTASLIDSVAQSYDNGEIIVIDNPTTYSFEVRFVGTKGIPPNLDDLKAAIEQIKPAHLGVEYVLTFNTNDILSNHTNNSLKAYTYEQLRSSDL